MIDWYIFNLVPIHVMNIIIKPGMRRPQAGARLVLKIDFVQIVGMCVCVYVCVNHLGYK